MSRIWLENLTWPEADRVGHANLGEWDFCIQYGGVFDCRIRP
jgi:hypothetical protein